MICTFKDQYDTDEIAVLQKLRKKLYFQEFRKCSQDVLQDKPV